MAPRNLRQEKSFGSSQSDTQSGNLDEERKIPNIFHTPVLEGSMCPSALKLLSLKGKLRKGHNRGT